MNSKFNCLKQSFFLTVLCFFISGHISAQFIDNFDDKAIVLDSTALAGWSFFTGDGSATMRFQPGNGYASILVDATKDRQNIWWALIKRCVSSDLDLNRLAEPGNELQIAARIRVSHAPRRVNLHLNTQRTTDFHSHLMEFDIPDTLNWHTISMTSHDFDVQPGDTVCGQLALMDWGCERYRVDLDYFKVRIVNIDSAEQDEGRSLPYRPSIPPVDKFKHHLTVAHDGMIDLEYPDENFNNWHVQEDNGITTLLTVSGTQLVILRWDLSEFSGRRAVGSGLLELTTYSVQCSDPDRKDFGMVRVSEILAGDPDWVQETVTYNTFCQGMSLNKVINSQMIIDVDVADGQGSTNLITISNPVLQRMLDGKTIGLAIRPLGPVNASFYAKENPAGNFSAGLHLNIDPGSD